MVTGQLCCIIYLVLLLIRNMPSLYLYFFQSRADSRNRMKGVEGLVLIRKDWLETKVTGNNREGLVEQHQSLHHAYCNTTLLKLAMQMLQFITTMTLQTLELPLLATSVAIKIRTVLDLNFARDASRCF